MVNVPEKGTIPNLFCSDGDACLIGRRPGNVAGDLIEKFVGDGRIWVVDTRKIITN